LPTPPSATQSYPPSLHDALPICPYLARLEPPQQLLEAFHVHRVLEAILYGLFHERMVGNIAVAGAQVFRTGELVREHHRQQILGDRKSTRLNSSHVKISYAVYCL